MATTARFPSRTESRIQNVPSKYQNLDTPRILEILVFNSTQYNSVISLFKDFLLPL